MRGCHFHNVGCLFLHWKRMRCCLPPKATQSLPLYSIQYSKPRYSSNQFFPRWRSNCVMIILSELIASQLTCASYFLMVYACQASTLCLNTLTYASAYTHLFCTVESKGLFFSPLNNVRLVKRYCCKEQDTISWLMINYLLPVQKKSIPQKKSH